MERQKPEVLITKKFPADIVDPLAEIAVVHMGDHCYNLMERRDVMAHIGRVSAIINQAELRVDAALLAGAEHLKVVANIAAGYDNFDLEEMTRRGIWGTNTPGHFHYPVAEYIIAGILSVMRRLGEADRFVRENQWTSFQPGRWDGHTLAGKTLGIIGMGTIGTSLARLASALGMEVVCHSRRKDIRDMRNLPMVELLHLSDVVSVNVSYNKETHELITDREFTQMKPGVIFVNTSRGKVVREADLLQHLSTGHLGGAVLDVFSEEPSVPDVLKTMPQVLLTPHIAGGTHDGRLASYRLAVDNVIAVLQGKRPPTPVNQIN
jgi:glyoxylate reductase